MNVTQSSLSLLHDISRLWAARNHPENLPADIPLRQLPPTSYHGDACYNGFSVAERQKADQVMTVLRWRGFLSPEAGCAICGSQQRAQLHNEDYFDPFAAVAMRRVPHDASSAL